MQDNPQTIPFREFHRFYAGPVLNFVRALGVRDADVADLVQEVFVVAFQRREGVLAAGAMTSWLFSVTRKKVANYRRLLSNKHTPPSEKTDDEPTLLDVDSQVESHRVLLIAAIAVLEKLPEPERLAWELRHLDGMGLGEVAAHCGCSLSEVKRRIYAAERAVKAVLERNTP
jgi:RNA polymerase sigma-70 factor, ECF subfamily